MPIQSQNMQWFLEGGLFLYPDLSVPTLTFLAIGAKVKFILDAWYHTLFHTCSYSIHSMHISIFISYWLLFRSSLSDSNPKIYYQLFISVAGVWDFRLQAWPSDCFPSPSDRIFLCTNNGCSKNILVKSKILRLTHLASITYWKLIPNYKNYHWLADSVTKCQLKQISYLKASFELTKFWVNCINFALHKN